MLARVKYKSCEILKSCDIFETTQRAPRESPHDYTPKGGHAHTHPESSTGRPNTTTLQREGTQLPTRTTPATRTTRADRSKYVPTRTNFVAYTNRRVAAFSCSFGARRGLSTTADTEEANPNSPLSCYPQLAAQSALPSVGRERESLQES